MKPSSTSIGARLGVLAVSLFLLGQWAQRGKACGVDWSVPRDYFNGVNELGFVSYWDKIGEIDIGESEKLPLVIGFQSDRERSSPYLGYGWNLPLLDSYMVQKDENNFEIMKPGGYTSGFGRDSKNPSLIGGVKGWKGRIEGDTIKVWADCGWSLTYTKGKLTDIGTPKNKSVRINRDPAGIVNDVTMDSKVLLKVRRGAKGVVTGLELADGKVIALEQGQKARMQAFRGRNLVVGKDLSLERIVFPNGTQTSYEHGLNEELQATLNIVKSNQKPRLIVWDPGTKFITADADWSYQIRPTKDGEYAAINRTNKQKQSEFWHYDASSGVEIEQRLDGVKIITTSFVSGKMAGNTRKKEEVIGDVKKTIYHASYDENGDLIGETLRFGEYKRYEKIGGLKVVTIFVDGVPAFQKQFDSAGDLVSFKPLAKQN